MPNRRQRPDAHLKGIWIIRGRFPTWDQALICANRRSWDYGQQKIRKVGQNWVVANASG